MWATKEPPKGPKESRKVKPRRKRKSKGVGYPFGKEAQPFAPPRRHPRFAFAGCRHTLLCRDRFQKDPSEAIEGDRRAPPPLSISSWLLSLPPWERPGFAGRRQDGDPSFSAFHLRCCNWRSFNNYIGPPLPFFALRGPFLPKSSRAGPPFFLFKLSPLDLFNCSIPF